MKNRMAVIAALIIGIGCWPSEVVVMAEEADGKNKSSDCLLEDYLDNSLLEMKGEDISSNSEDLLEIEENHFFEQPRNMFDVEEKETAEEDTDAENDNKNEEKDEEEDSEKLVEEKESAGDEVAASVMKNLQIPQKLDVVIDPWEMDGRGQIYSDEYVIRNEGETTGTLTLSNLACKSQESGNVIVRSDKNGLHDNGEKALYMEMWFGDSDCIVLSGQETKYQAELKPGEELTVCFTGEVNEYASEDWVNGDVRVSVVYSWDVEEALANENVDDKGTAEVENAATTEELEEASENEEVEESKDSSEHGELNESVEDVMDGEDNLQKEVEGAQEEDIFYIAGEMQTGDENVQEEAEVDRIKVIELSEDQEMKAVVDSWETEPDHRIASAKYLIRNVGEKTGVFSLTDLVCLPKEESGIQIKTVQKEVQDVDEKAIYMEMVLENGDKVVLAQEGSEYRVELEPGEEMEVQFVGVVNADMSGDWEEDSVVIDAGCSWEIEE